MPAIRAAIPRTGWSVEGKVRIAGDPTHGPAGTAPSADERDSASHVDVHVQEIAEDGCSTDGQVIRWPPSSPRSTSRGRPGAPRS